jgi:hypothetical protein
MSRLAITAITVAAAIFLRSVFISVDEITTFLLQGFSGKRLLAFIDRDERQSGLHVARVGLLALLALALFYFLPTGIEWMLLQRFNPWVASILFGDLVGCAFLAFEMGLKKTAGFIYVTATVVEILLYVSNLVPGHWLIWVTDSLPAAVIIGCIWMRMKRPLLSLTVVQSV